MPELAGASRGFALEGALTPASPRCVYRKSSHNNGQTCFANDALCPGARVADRGRATRALDGANHHERRMRATGLEDLPDRIQRRAWRGPGPDLRERVPVTHRLGGPGGHDR